MEAATLPVQLRNVWNWKRPGKHTCQRNEQLRLQRQRTGAHLLCGNELCRCDDVFWKERPSQRRSFCLHELELEEDYELEGLLGRVVHECHT